MMAQTDELAKETRVMRLFDTALQAARQLPPRAAARTVDHIMARLEDHKELLRQEAQKPNGKEHDA